MKKCVRIRPDVKEAERVREDLSLGAQSTSREAFVLFMDFSENLSKRSEFRRSP